MRTVTFDLDDAGARFMVLVNGEQQYSLWPADLPVPGGWNDTQVVGSRSVCEEYVQLTWTDLRPATLQNWDKAQPT
jgi:MbtH protein